MIVIGYTRTSKPNQKIKRQISNLKKYNSEILIFQESYSSKTLERPQFQKMLKYAYEEKKEA